MRSRGMRFAACAFVLFLLMAGPVALAIPGNVQDPDDTSYKIDIRAVYHNDDASGNVTYYIQAYDNFQSSYPDDNDMWVCDTMWDFNEDDQRDGTVQVSMQWESTAIVYNANGDEVSRDASVSRAAVGPPHTAQGSSAQNTLKITVSKSSLVKAGMGSGDNGYDYVAFCGDPNSDAGDETTNGQFGTRHTFGGTNTPAPTTDPGTPRPTSPPQPTQQPQQTDVPATEETPTPAPEGETPDPGTAAGATATPDGSPDESDLAVGTEDTGGGGSGVPLAVGIVVAFIAAGSGIGLFLARRRGL